MRLNDEAKIKPYLAGVTKNQVRKKCRTIEINYDIEEYENELMESDFSDNIIECQEQKEILNIIEVLEKEEYEIFTMFYYDSKKIKEIAKTLNYSEGKIKVKLHRIRKKLKKIFKERGYGYGR